MFNYVFRTTDYISYFIECILRKEYHCIKCLLLGSIYYEKNGLQPTDEEGTKKGSRM